PEEPLQMHVEVSFVGDEAYGTVGQAIRRPDVFHLVSKGELEERDQTGDIAGVACFLRLVRLVRLDLRQIGAATRDRLELLALEFTDRRDPELVDRMFQ